MRIDSSFTVGLPVQEVWKVLLDVERIAPCIPGAQLHETTGEEHRGALDVTLGAITARYQGAVRVTEVDEVGRRIVLGAHGTETEGGGDASATVTAYVRPADESSTEVVLETELTISGPMAQYDGGVMADVASTLVGDFAHCLEEDLLARGREEAAMAPPTPEEVVADEIGDLAVEDPERAAQLVSAVTTGATHPVESTPTEPVDRSALDPGSMAERAVPAAIVGVLLLQVLPKGRIKRLGLAVLGSALVAGLVAGKDQQRR